MKKTGFGVLAIIVATLLLASCGNDVPAEDSSITSTENSTSTETSSSVVWRTGNQVSDAYVDPDSINHVPAAQVKAVGYEYDYDALTYELVWSDEFDYEGKPDTTKWGYDTGGSGWGNNELQYYTAGENVEVKDGYCVITARKEDYKNSSYTSTRMVSRNKGDWLYGKIEVCAKLPVGKGTWPAIWMLPTDYRYGSWPASGEIDIMEHVGYDQDNIHGSIHTQSYYHKINTQKTATKKVSGVSEEFHVYSLEWLPDQIIIYIDDVEYFRFKPTKYKAEPTFKEWPFDKRMHLLINLAIGGDWGGARGIDESIFPQEFVIDYVRVYQSPEINELINK